jgi:hypothetical protein
VKVREPLLLRLEEDSADWSTGSGRGGGDFPEAGEPALSGLENPGKPSLGASSAQELPGPRLQAEISVGESPTRMRLVAASLLLPLLSSFDLIPSIDRIS